MEYQELHQKKISAFIETQLPDFVRSQFTLNNGKTLIHRFVELYYEWMEKEYDLTIVDMSGRTIKEFGSTKIFNTQNEVGNPYNILTKLQGYTDIDRTIYPLLLFLRKQFMLDIPHDIETDLRKTLKLMKHYNVRKGTKKAFEFISEYCSIKQSMSRSLQIFYSRRAFLNGMSLPLCGLKLLVELNRLLKQI